MRCLRCRRLGSPSAAPSPRSCSRWSPGPGQVLTRELSPQEAALAAEYRGAEVAIACHYLNAQQPDVVDFLALVPQHDGTGRRRVNAPEVSETLIVETWDGGETMRVERSGAGKPRLGWLTDQRECSNREIDAG